MALQNGCDFSTIKWYIRNYEDKIPDLKKCMKENPAPALYYAVQRNPAEAVQLLMDYGADPANYELFFAIPVIAFAIIYGYRNAINTTAVVRQLLANGQDPQAIPKDMWEDYSKQPSAFGHKYTDGPTAWCYPELREEPSCALFLGHRYDLHHASRLPRRKARELQTASLHNMINLFKVPYYIVGQLPSLILAMRRVYTHIANRVPQPLIVAFAGPSGHGKTELAFWLGGLLNVKHKVIDCSHLDCRGDLLGGSNFYHRSDEGSDFYNFVSKNNGKRAVIVLDEFDKTEKAIRDTLLIVLDKGKLSSIPFLGNAQDSTRNFSYSNVLTTATQDRFLTAVQTKLVDCSKFIWILATNFGDSAIERFYERNVKDLSSEARDKVSLTPIQAELRESFQKEFGVSRSTSSSCCHLSNVV